MKCHIRLVVVLLLMVILTGCVCSIEPSNTELGEHNEHIVTEKSMKTNLYVLAFSASEVEQIAVGNGRIDVNIQTEKTLIETKDDALAYGEKLYRQLEEADSRYSYLKPFAILRDAGSDVWGVAFGSGEIGIGGGISMAFSPEGSIIAIWEGE